MSGKVFLPSNNEYQESDGPLIFLAGPAKGAPLWQKEAIEIIHSIDPSIHIATPRFPDKKVKVEDFILEKQAYWEQIHLEYARRTGAIIFACPLPIEETPGRDYGRTTRNEMGVFQERCNVNGDKLFVWMEEGFQGKHYLDSVHQDFYQTRNESGEIICGVIPVGNLTDLCRKAIIYILTEKL